MIKLKSSSWKLFPEAIMSMKALGTAGHQECHMEGRAAPDVTLTVPILRQRG